MCCLLMGPFFFSTWDTWGLYLFSRADAGTEAFEERGHHLYQKSSVLKTQHDKIMPGNRGVSISSVGCRECKCWGDETDKTQLSRPCPLTSQKESDKNAAHHKLHL